MPDSIRPIRVYPFYLTGTVASEQLYGRELCEALSDRDIRIVDTWREADIVHLFEVNMYIQEALASFKFPKLLRILRSDVRLVVSTDDLYFTSDPSLTAYPWLYPVNARTQGWLLRNCDAIIAISESVKRTIEPSVPDTDVHVVRHGVHDRYFAEPTTGDEPFVLHVSFASKRKNPEAVVEVAARFEHHFVIAGGGWDEYIPERLRNDDDVELAGYVSETDLVELYQQAAIFYFPTLHEGFGLPILEAMAAGNAIVSSNVYAVPEITDDAAVLHDPHDIDAHLASLRTLVGDDEKRMELGKAAHERATGFSWERTAAETEAVYRSVLSR